MVGNVMVRWRAAGLFVLAVSLACCVRLALWQSQAIVDEGVHVPQVASFLAGRWDTQPNLAMIPGYHIVMAALMSASGLSSLGAMRDISAGFGVTAALVFFFIRRKLGDDDALLSASLFFAFPLFFPYDFLVYTDIFSLTVVLLAVLSALHGRHFLAACIMTLSLAVRQNNIIWAVFLATYAAWPSLSALGNSVRARLGRSIAAAAPYLLPALAFLAYWRWNGTIVFSSGISGAHPDLTLHGGNVWLALFLFLVLFPREAWSGVISFGEAVRLRPWLLLIPLCLAVWTRMHGSGDNQAFQDYFIRNAFIAFVAHGWARVCFSILVALAACSIVFTRLRDQRGWLIYPFSVICLASSALIENRYSIVPFALWMAFRQENSPRWMLPVWLGLSLFLTYGVLTLKFML
ncbi:alpha-1,2-glucosyltransferase [Luteibacter sp. HA06]